MSMTPPPSREVDFMVRLEDWSRYLVNDGTELRVRIVVRKIIEINQPDPNGYPGFGIESMNVVSAIVPDKLKRQPSTTPFNPQTQRGEEVNFITQEEKWQEYHTHDGFKVLVKPILVKVRKYDSYNMFGEPVYNVNIQSIVNAEKINQSQ